MELHPLVPPDLEHLTRRGEVRRLYRPPRTVEEVLRDASRAMDLEDEAERYRADPVLWIRGERRKRSLFWRLFG
jgi:hypothetical protein